MKAEQLGNSTLKLNLKKWKGHCKASFAQPGYTSVDKFIEDVRGR